MSLIKFELILAIRSIDRMVQNIRNCVDGVYTVRNQEKNVRKNRKNVSRRKWLVRAHERPRALLVGLDRGRPSARAARGS